MAVPAVTQCALAGSSSSRLLLEFGNSDENSKIGILKNCFHCLFCSILKSLCAIVLFCFPDPLLFVCRHKKRGLSAFATYECHN